MNHYKRDGSTPLQRSGGTLRAMSVGGFAITMALAIAAQLALASPVSATSTIIEQGPIDVEEHFVVEDSCDVPGLTQQVDITFNGWYSIRLRGRDRLPYFDQAYVGDHRYTNLANGKFVTVDQRVRARDIAVVDNDDGTTTGIYKVVDRWVMRDMHGQAIARTNLTSWYRWTLDNMGTPSDPSDDENFEEVLIREKGRADDGCAANVAATTGDCEARASGANLSESVSMLMPPMGRMSLAR